MRITLARLGALIVCACATPLTPADVMLRPTSIIAVTSEAFTATVGATVRNEPVVLVKDNYDEPLPGQTVTFSASSGTQPVPASVTTDDQGRASPSTWELPRASGSVTLSAAVAGSTVASRQFVVTLNPGPAATADVAPSNATDPPTNNQTAAAGASVQFAPRVRVADQYGNAVPNVSVTFAVTGGGGTVVPATPVQTNASGIAQPMSWTMGTGIGINTLRASVQGISSPVEFTATSVSGPPSTIAA